MSTSYSGPPRKNKVLEKNKRFFGTAYRNPEIGLLETTEDVEIWVATTGFDDRRGNGTEFLPYATVERALQDVPFKIKHNVHIRVGSGTYTSFPDYVHHRCSTTGTLYIEGLGTPTASSGPFTVNTYSAPSAYSTILVTGAGWTVDEFYDKWVRVTVGDQVGMCLPVFKNTADTIYIPRSGIGTVTEIEILDAPPVKFELSDGDQAIVFDTGKIGNGPSLVLAGVHFKHTGEGKVTFQDSEVFTAFTKCEIPDNNVLSNRYNLHINDSNLNSVTPVDTSVLDTTVYNHYYSGKLLSSKGGIVWTGDVARGVGIGGFCRVFGICDRFIVQAYWGTTCFMSVCMCASVKIYEWMSIAIYNSTFDHAAAAYTYPPVLAEGGLIMISCHIGGSNTGYGILTGTGGPAELSYLTGDAGLTYGAWVAAGSSVRISNSISLTGSSDDFKWDVDDTSGSWPTTGGSSVTDNKGAYVYYYDR